jgi:aminomethyltransferase
LNDPAAGPLKRTPLYDLHRELGARLVPFAGYEMPVQYPTGILAEHTQTRTSCGLFDVSHMGQVRLTAKAGHSAAKALETLVPGDIVGLQPGQQRYTQFTNDQGGILDDLMVTSTGDHLLVVINAACKDADLAHMQKHLSGMCEVEPMFSRGLLALQGPQASAVLSRLAPQVATMKFMTGAYVVIDGARCYVTRSGYTGGDGYEISTPADQTDAIARKLLSHSEVKPIGLGARDSLRLEAGLPLYGHDLTPAIDPAEADARLGASASERRVKRLSRRGASSSAISPTARRASASACSSMATAGRARGRGKLFGGEDEIGVVTSGGFAPSVGAPIAMGYVPSVPVSPGRRSRPWCAASACLAPSPPCPSSNRIIMFVKQEVD